MSENKTTVQRYIDGFNRSDHALILSCLTDDVVWDMPGTYHHVGKEAFDQEMTPGWADNSVDLLAVAQEGDLAGVWAHSIITGPYTGGSFQAVRQ